MQEILNSFIELRSGALSALTWPVNRRNERALHMIIKTVYFLAPGPTHIGPCLRYDDDERSTRLAYGTTLVLVSNGTWHTEDDTITICSRRCDTIQ
jgi:hypothetical protein